MKKLNNLLLLMLMLAVVAVTTNSCDDDEPEDGIVNFEEEAIDRTTDDLSPITVNLTIEPSAPEASEIVVAISGAEAGTVFTTTPEMSNGEVTLNVEEGANSASLTVTPKEEGIGFDDVVLQLSLSSVGDGLTTGLTTSSQINITNAKDTGEPLPFMEEFESCAEGGSKEVPPEGWTEEVVQQNAEGSAVWKCIAEGRAQQGIEANAFVPGSEDNINSEVWLISPRIDLIDATSPTLNFDVDRRFDPTDNFTEDHYDIRISTDYNGLNFESATWERFQAGYDAMTDNDPGADGATNTGDLDLSAYTGKVIAIAFVYRAGAPGSFDATILRIGNVSVTD